MIKYADTGAITRTWLLTTTVAPLLKRADGGYSIYLGGLAKTAPMPALVLREITGGPEARKDLPEQRVTIQFDCWAKTRSDAVRIANTLVAELEELPLYGGAVIDGTYLGTAHTSLVRWLPDPDSDTPRYIVDAVITTVT